MNPISTIAVAEKRLLAIQSVRANERRGAHPSDPDRQARILAGIEEVDAAMKPIRSLRGQYLWEDTLLDEPDYERLCSVSKQLQYERRQLKKMLRR
jgi:hypothetical protein